MRSESKDVQPSITLSSVSDAHVSPAAVRILNNPTPQPLEVHILSQFIECIIEQPYCSTLQLSSLCVNKKAARMTQWFYLGMSH